MAYPYRRRDSARSGHSSADAYRTARTHFTSRLSSSSSAPRLPPGATTMFPSPPSSEEEAHLTSHTPHTDSVQSTHTPSSHGHDNDNADDVDEPPLVPPRPFFIAGNRKDSGVSSDNTSWNSSAGMADTSDVASDSDRDIPDREQQALVRNTPTGVKPKPAMNQASSSASPRYAHSRSNTAEFITPPVQTNNNNSSQILIRPRNPNRRRGSSSSQAPSEKNNPFDTPTPVTSPRAPPSAFPFLSHAGNPDPGTPIPGSLARRASQESFRRLSKELSPPPSVPNSATGTTYPVAGAGGYAAVRAMGGGGDRSSIDVVDAESELGRPYAPFMSRNDERKSWSSNGTSNGASTPPLSGGQVYKNSAAAGMAGSSSHLTGGGDGTLPRTPSQPQIAMRAPFLSPASRPSSIWSPPSYPSLPPPNTYPTSTYPPSLTYLPSSPYVSGLSPYASYPKRTKALMPSTRLEQKLDKEDKPWLTQKQKRERSNWWLTFVCMLLGVAGSGVLIYFGWTGVQQLKDEDLCLVLNEGFNSLDLDNTWTRDVELGGFGNGEFEIATASSDNLYIRNNQLYIMPTLTSDEIGTDAILNGGSYDLGDACTAGHDSFSISGTSDSGNCTASSDGGKNVIPPVKSARLSTKGHYSIRYGKVEVRAKLPRGDWLWPAIWMLPVNNTYGPWPLSGEIDIMEARGNAQSYAAQGINFVRSSLNYGPLSTVQTHIVGWFEQKRFTYADDFHTFSLEWTPDWMRFYVDTRLKATINLKITGKTGKSFFDRGAYPATAHNGSDAQVVVSDIWQEEGGVASAPFDQEFFLILDLAAGGTSGWFPDGVGDKPWLDGSDTAMKSFAQAQDTWYKTWPSNQDERAFRIDSVKMWSMKSHGKCG